jgi:hypothetical protein
MATFPFVENSDQLIDSVVEFYSKPEYYKQVLRSSPKYFVHFKQNGTHLFGLSKFCACKNITVEEYISTYRYKTDGGTTQKHISRIINQQWIRRNNVDNEVKVAFDKWITDFFPNYSVVNASFITLTVKKSKLPQKRGSISLDALLKNLERQTQIGKVGEEIAYKFEIARYKEAGVNDSSFVVDIVSNKNAAAGYDIYSSAKKETRFIEVKSSLSGTQDFYVTANEIQTLTTLGKEAFLYFVHIINLKRKIGNVYKIYQDPIRTLKNVLVITPLLYKAQIKNIC